MEKTNFLQKCREKERCSKVFVNGMKRLLQHRRGLPKMVRLLFDFRPDLATPSMRKEAIHALDVLNKYDNPEAIRKALAWEPLKRERVFGCQQEYPVRIALGLVEDLQAGRDIFNPSEDDLSASRVFILTADEYIPYCGMSVASFNSQKFGWFRAFVASRKDLAPARERMQLMDEWDLRKTLHPVALEIYRNKINGTFAGSKERDALENFCETLSELLKKYDSRVKWQNDLEHNRVVSKVPEYRYIGEKKRKELNKIMRKVLA